MGRRSIDHHPLSGVCVCVCVCVIGPLHRRPPPGVSVIRSICDRVPFLSKGSPPPPTARPSGPSRARRLTARDDWTRSDGHARRHACSPLLLLSLARPRAASAPSRPIPSARLPGAPMREGAHPPHPPPRAGARPLHVQSMLLSPHQCSSSPPPPFPRRSQCTDTVSRRRSDDRLVRAAARARALCGAACAGASPT